MKAGPKRIAKHRARYARIKSDPEALERLRAQQRAYKKRRYAENPSVRQRVINESRNKYATRRATSRGRAFLLLGGARKRAQQAGLEFDLDLADILGPLTVGTCQVTGIPFDLSPSKTRTNPWAPSIDRIDSTRGYTKSNIKIVCAIHNIAKNEWSIEVFNAYVTAYVRNNSI